MLEPVYESEKRRRVKQYPLGRCYVVSFSCIVKDPQLLTWSKVKLTWPAAFSQLGINITRTPEVRFGQLLRPDSPHPFHF